MPTVTLKTTDKATLTCEYSYTQDVANNRSTLTLSMYITPASGYTIGPWGDFNGSYLGTTGLTFDGSIGSITSKTLLATKTLVINHNADGTGSATIYWKWGVNSSWGGYVNPSGSFGITLTTIPRASQPTLSNSNPTMGNAITIETHRASTAFTHTLKYTFGNQSGTIVSNLATDYVWTVPLTLANAIPNATSGSGVITCETYNGAILIGTKTVAFTANVPTTVVPVINSVHITEAVAGLAAKFLAYVQNKSKLTVATSASGAYSSTISQIKVTIESKNYTGASITSDIITGSGTISVVVLVTDSRGRTKSQTVNVTVVAYTNPVINAMDAYRVNGSGAPTDDGTSIAIPMNFVIASVNSKNNKTWLLEYRIVGAPSWTTLASGSTYIYDSIHSNLTGLFSGDNSYEIRLTITDYFTSISRIVSIGTAFSLINYNLSGKGIAFGKVSEGDMFEMALDAYFTGLIKKNGNDVMDLIDMALHIGTLRQANANLIPYTQTDLEQGVLSLSTGAPSASTNYLRSKDFVPILPSTKYQFEASAGVLVYALMYNSSYAFIGYFVNNVHTTFVTGATAAYFKIRMQKDPTPSAFVVSEVINYKASIIKSNPQSGSNANGEYVKFEDGTLICWMAITVTTQAINNAYGSLFQGTRVWTFPVAFIARPSVTCSEFQYDTGASWGTVNGPASLTAVTLRGLDAYSRAAGSPCNISAIAIGRWKA